MKTDLDHLPQAKREQIQRIVEIVRGGATVEMIVLFGSHARGDWVRDPVHGYFSDFDFLVIVATDALADDPVLWARLTDQARQITGSALVSFIVHPVGEINHEIRCGQYFFSEIVSQGVLVHDSRRFTLATPKALTARERRELAEHSFRYWFDSASGFWRGSVYYRTLNLGPHAAFLLHQAAERYFHAVLLVFTGYKPKTHDIKALAEQTAPLHPALADALPRTAAEDQRLFDLLRRAYIDARYSRSYRVTAEELQILQERVLDLATRARQSCAGQLAAIGGGEAPVGLPEVPRFGEAAIELPEAPPALDDPAALAAWRDAVAAVAHARGQVAGEERGREAGLREGRARAIVDVLHRRTIRLTADDADRILACRNDSTLAEWWNRVWYVATVVEMFGDG